MGWVSRLIEWVALVWWSLVWLCFGDPVWCEVFRRRLTDAVLLGNGSGAHAPRDKV
jgi:hypothetical protein